MNNQEVVNKEQVKRMIQNMEKPWNKKLVAEYLAKLDNIKDEEWESFISNFMKNNVGIEEWLKEKFKLVLSPNVELNELISYGITEDTLHIHLLPKDVGNLIYKRDYVKLKFINALESIKNILQTDENMKDINNVFAVSPILKIKHLQDMFIEMGFDIEETTDEQLIERFPEGKKVYEETLSKEKLFSDEWEKNKQKILNDDIQK